jgi:ABC-type multidrug transport system ATPase subunit
MPAEGSCGRLTGVSKRFGRRGSWILRDINLVLLPGSRTVIVGGNGSGKSTLLRVAAGLTRPTAGTVIRSPAISYAPERLPGRSNFTAWEYLGHMGRIRGLDRVTVETRSGDLVERLGLLPDPNAPIDSLSKGNKQKVIIAQAFLAPVGLIVLDEPYSGLDDNARWTLDDLADAEQDRGTAVLLSSHADPMRPRSDQVCRIVDGGLTQIPFTAGAPEYRRIELTGTERSCAAEQIISAAGLHRVDHDHRRGVLSLDVEASDADALLHKAITNGWSVTGVVPLPAGDTGNSERTGV